MSDDKQVQFIPETMVTVTPHLVIENCAEAMKWYEKAFDAKELMRMPGPGGAIMHAHMTIGSGHILLVDQNPDWNMKGPKALGGTPVTLHLYVEDTDAQFKKAIDNGAVSLMEPMDAFWGDRFSKVVDPYGHIWSIATVQNNLTQEEMEAGMQAAMADMG